MPYLPAAPLRYVSDVLRLSIHATRPADWSPLGRRSADDLGRLLLRVDDGEWREAEALGARLMERRPDAGPGGGSLNPGDRRALYALVRAVKPQAMLEFGTHLGSSTLFAGLALARNAAEGAPGRLTTVDIRDVNGPDGAWARVGAWRSPAAMVDEAGLADRVRFVTGRSTDFLDDTDEQFDLCFLDGSHAAGDVYDELQRLPGALAPDALVLLHDYFPEARPLWPGQPPLPGPFLAVERLIRDGAPVAAVPLGELPWPTKAGSSRTSLAVLSHA